MINRRSVLQLHSATLPDNSSKQYQFYYLLLAGNQSINSWGFQVMLSLQTMFIRALLTNAQQCQKY